MLTNEASFVKVSLRSCLRRGRPGGPATSSEGLPLPPLPCLGGLRRSFATLLMKSSAAVLGNTAADRANGFRPTENRGLVRRTFAVSHPRNRTTIKQLVSIDDLRCPRQAAATAEWTEVSERPNFTEKGR